MVVSAVIPGGMSIIPLTFMPATMALFLTIEPKLSTPTSFFFSTTGISYRSNALILATASESPVSGVIVSNFVFMSSEICFLSMTDRSISRLFSASKFSPTIFVTSCYDYQMEIVCPSTNLRSRLYWCLGVIILSAHP